MPTQGEGQCSRASLVTHVYTAVLITKKKLCTVAITYSTSTNCLLSKPCSASCRPEGAGAFVVQGQVRGKHAADTLVTIKLELKFIDLK